MRINSNSTISIGLAVLLGGAIYLAGGNSIQISANAEDNERQDVVIDQLKTAVTRGIITQENIATLLARQAAADEDVAETLSELSERALRLEILIERLSQEGGTMNRRME